PAHHRVLRQRGCNRKAAGRRRPDPAAWPPRLPEVLWRARRDKQAPNDAGHNLCPSFHDQANHQSGGDDADRCRQACTRRSRLKIHPGLCQSAGGLEMTDAQGEPTLKLVPAARQVTILDLLRHTSEISYGYIGGKWVLKVYSQANLFSGKF